MTNRYDECKEELIKAQNELDAVITEYRIEKEEKRKEDQEKEEECKDMSERKEEKLMDIKKKEKLLSNTMTQILKGAKTYNSIHIKLIWTIMEYLKPLEKREAKSFDSKRAEDVIREILADFLFRFKDKHPFKDPKEGKVTNVFNTIMDFMYKYGFEPSKSLKEEYKESEFNRKLNTLPEFEYLNSKYENGFPIEKYKFMKSRLESITPFVFYFNPDIQLDEHFELNKDGNRCYFLGFYSKGTNKAIGVAFKFNDMGVINQGYWKENKMHNYGRVIGSSGNIYEGSWNEGNAHGKGVYEFYKSGRRDVGQWANDKREAEFKCYDKQNNIIVKHYKNGKKIRHST